VNAPCALLLLLLLGRGPLPTLAGGFGRAVPAPAPVVGPRVGSALDDDDDIPLTGAFGPVAGAPVLEALDPAADAPLPGALNPAADATLPGPLDPAAAVAPPLLTPPSLPPPPVDANGGGGNREATSSLLNSAIVSQSSGLLTPRCCNSACKRLSFTSSSEYGIRPSKRRSWQMHFRKAGSVRMSR
jgi:hypothetical protein